MTLHLISDAHEWINEKLFQHRIRKQLNSPAGDGCSSYGAQTSRIQVSTLKDPANLAKSGVRGPEANRIGEKTMECKKKRISYP